MLRFTLVSPDSPCLAEPHLLGSIRRDNGLHRMEAPGPKAIYSPCVGLCLCTCFEVGEFCFPKSLDCVSIQFVDWK